MQTVRKVARDREEVEISLYARLTVPEIHGLRTWTNTIEIVVCLLQYLEWFSFGLADINELHYCQLILNHFTSSVKWSDHLKVFDDTHCDNDF